MEDVVLHWRPSQDLRPLLRTARRLLEPFPVRTPPPFSPWFPTTRRPLPIRPAKPPPVITCSGDASCSRVMAVEKPLPEDSAPLRRSWSMSGQGAARPSGQRSGGALSHHRLHPLQRARWVIGRHHCGPTRTLEQVWRCLCGAMRSASLPTCNANFQRERAEIWVFCDVERAEQVGRHLKGALQLSGTISLSVRKMANILSL